MNNNSGKQRSNVVGDLEAAYDLSQQNYSTIFEVFNAPPESAVMPPGGVLMNLAGGKSQSRCFGDVMFHNPSPRLLNIGCTDCRVVERGGNTAGCHRRYTQQFSARTADCWSDSGG